MDVQSVVWLIPFFHEATPEASEVRIFPVPGLPPASLIWFPDTPTAPAMAFTCDTMSFHAAEESVVPAFGSAPHAAAAKLTPHQTRTSDTQIPSPIWIPFRRFLLNSFIFWVGR